MTITEIYEIARYVTNAEGERTDVLLPLQTWKSLLGSWRQMIALLEDREDMAVFREWLEERAAGEGESISLDELEAELIADGLLQS
ncbi:MAG: hypothetical protein KKD28_00080 [Chloroflexi bacterium]|nr:hypothetical protein [Chloroflexota bacterium]MBU1659853.1 hypothetical protein [Chloroflexota bacterium]